MLAGIAVLLVILLAGCNPIKPQNRMECAAISAAPYAHAHASATVPRQHLKELWWQQFHDRQLQRLMEQMLRDNQSVEAARARVAAARAALHIQQAQLLPWLDISGSATRQRLPAAVETQGNVYTLQASAGYEVDLWRKLDERSAAAQARLEISKAERDAAILSFSAQLATAYYIYQQQCQQLDIARTQEDLRHRYRDFVKLRYNYGLEPSREIYKAQQAYDNAANVAELLNINRVNSRHTIAALLGIRYNRLHLRPLPQFPVKLPLPRHGVPADLLLRRPDVKAAWQRFAAADAEHAAAVAEQLPSLTLQAAAGLTRNSVGIKRIDDIFWSLAASAVQPLFDGGRRKWRVEQQQALVNQRRAEAQQTLLAAITEVEQLLNKLEGEQRMINRLSHREQQASADLERVRRLYDKGAADALHVIEANDFTLTLRRQLLQTRYQHVASTIALIRALGGTWMARYAKAEPTP